LVAAKAAAALQSSDAVSFGVVRSGGRASRASFGDGSTGFAAPAVSEEETSDPAICRDPVCAEDPVRAWACTASSKQTAEHRKTLHAAQRNIDRNKVPALIVDEEAHHCPAKTTVMWQGRCGSLTQHQECPLVLEAINKLAKPAEQGTDPHQRPVAIPSRTFLSRIGPVRL
jgi:hypothetical protein